MTKQTATSPCGTSDSVALKFWADVTFGGACSITSEDNPGGPAAGGFDGGVMGIDVTTKVAASDCAGASATIDIETETELPLCATVGDSIVSVAESSPTFVGVGAPDPFKQQ